MYVSILQLAARGTAGAAPNEVYYTETQRVLYVAPPQYGSG